MSVGCYVPAWVTEPSGRARLCLCHGDVYVDLLTGDYLRPTSEAPWEVRRASVAEVEKLAGLRWPKGATPEAWPDPWWDQRQVAPLFMALMEAITTLNLVVGTCAVRDGLSYGKRNIRRGVALCWRSEVEVAPFPHGSDGDAERWASGICKHVAGLAWKFDGDTKQRVELAPAPYPQAIEESIHGDYAVEAAWREPPTRTWEQVWKASGWPKALRKLPALVEKHEQARVKYRERALDWVPEGVQLPLFQQEANVA